MGLVDIVRTEMEYTVREVKGTLNHDEVFWLAAMRQRLHDNGRKTFKEIVYTKEGRASVPFTYGRE